MTSFLRARTASARWGQEKEEEVEEREVEEATRPTSRSIAAFDVSGGGGGGAAGGAAATAAPSSVLIADALGSVDTIAVRREAGASERERARPLVREEKKKE